MPRYPCGDSALPKGIPEPRWHAQAFYHNGALHVVGGGAHDYAYEGNWKEVFSVDSTVLRFNASSGAWQMVPTTGELPIAHTYSTASAMVEDFFVIWFGGYYRVSHATCFALCLRTWHWAEVKINTMDAVVRLPRFYPSSCIVHQKMYAWGGRFGHGENERYFDDLMTLDVSRMCVSRQLEAFASLVATSGDVPTSKFATTLTNVVDERLVLYGGGQWKVGGLCDPDCHLHVLELESMEWSQICHAAVPRPRMQHQCKVIGGGALLLVLGGYDGRNRVYLGPEHWAVLNLHTLKWVLGASHSPEDVAEAEEEEDISADTFIEENTEVVPKGWLCGSLPSARAGFAVTTAPGREVMLFGGSKYVHKCWYRDVFELSFVPLQTAIREPPGADGDHLEPPEP